MAAQMTDMEGSICKVVQLFYQYSTSDKLKETLTKCEFEQLIKENLPNFWKNIGDIDELIKKIDTNNDQEVKFSEYWTLVGLVAKDRKRDEKRRH